MRYLAVFLASCAYGSIDATMQPLGADASDVTEVVQAPPYEVPDAAWPSGQPTFGGPPNRRVR